MGKNLETIGRMGKKTARLGIDTLGVVAGSLFFLLIAELNVIKLEMI